MARYGLQTMLGLLTATLRQSAYCCARFACSSGVSAEGVGAAGLSAVLTSAVMSASLRFGVQVIIAM